MRTDGALFGFARADGRRRFRRPWPEGGQVYLHAEGFAVRDRGRLSGYDDLGRARFTLRIPDTARVVVDAARAVAYVIDAEALESYDLARGRRRARHAGVTVTDLVVGEAGGALLLADGRLLAFDPAQL